MLCVWWDQSGIVYYELLKPGETVNTQRYRQQVINLNHALIERRPEWARRHGKVILLHDNAPSHSKTSERHLEIAWMGHPSAPAVFLRPGAI
ncbi:hypothetical protein P5V15_014721 [Pogonomyrmex californicus]